MRQLWVRTEYWLRLLFGDQWLVALIIIMMVCALLIISAHFGGLMWGSPLRTP